MAGNLAGAVVTSPHCSVLTLFRPHFACEINSTTGHQLLGKAILVEENAIAKDADGRSAGATLGACANLQDLLMLHLIR